MEKEPDALNNQTDNFSAYQFPENLNNPYAYMWERANKLFKSNKKNYCGVFLEWVLKDLDLKTKIYDVKNRPKSFPYIDDVMYEEYKEHQKNEFVPQIRNILTRLRSKDQIA